MASFIKNFEVLKDFSDSELEIELATRKARKEEADKRARKAKEVEVVCPRCNGRGAVQNGHIVEDTITCSLCNGNGFIIAVKRG